jgi:ABC-type multidrug transport system fused ATPase/permease subunit
MKEKVTRKTKKSEMKKISPSNGEKKEKQGVRVAISNLLWVIKEVGKISVIDIVGMFVVAVLIRTVPTLMAYFSSKVLDMVVSATNAHINGVQDFFQYSDNYKYILGLIIVYFFNSSLRDINRYFDRRFWIWDFRLFDMKMQRRLTELDVQQFEDSQVSNALQKSKDVLWKIFSSFQELVNTVSDLVSVFVVGAIVASLNPWLILLIFVLGLPQNIFNFLHIKRWWKWFEGQVESNRKMWWLRSIMSGGSMQEHKIYGSHVYLADTTEKIYKTNNKGELGVQVKRITSNIYALFFALPGYFLPMFYLIDLTLKGNITLGQMGFYTSNISTFSDKLNWVVAQIVEVYDMSSSITNMRYLFELKPVIETGPKVLKLSTAPVIEFRNVSFKYPKATKYALKNVSITIKPFEEVAIVGENGAGKSTFVRLLLRFYDPTEGDIFINGVNLREINVESYYKHVSALFQDYLIYQPLNVKENIGMGKPFEKVMSQRIEEAAKLADADKFISDLDNKYDQILNRNFSGGVNLSTGQWQKLALARLFYKNSPILILDEPTSSIDAVAESKIFNRIYRFMKKKSVIIISHRFSTVRKAKKIYVFNAGKIVESGSHEDLMNLKGKYSKAYNLQASGYQV